MMLYVWFACILFCFASGGEFEIYCQDGVIPTEVVCTYQEPGLYRLLSLDTRVTRVIFNRLTNSQVLVPDGIKQISILSSTSDSLSLCEHVISSNSINVYIEDQDVLRHCHPATQSATQPTREPGTQPSTHMILEPATQEYTEAGPATQSATQPTREPGTQPNHEPTIQSSTHMILEPATQEYTEAGVTANINIVIPVVVILIIIIIIIIIFIIIKKKCARRQLRNRNDIADIAFNGSEETVFEMVTEFSTPTANVKPLYKTD